MPNQSKKIYRSNQNKIISGVCGGLAEYFNIDVTIIRIIFILLVFADGGGILIYIILWILIPAETGEKVSINREGKIKEFTKNVGEKVQEMAKELKNNNGRFLNNKRNLIGVIIIAIGLILLFNQLFPLYWFKWHIFWPMVIILIGLYLIIKNKRK